MTFQFLMFYLYLVFSGIDFDMILANKSFWGLIFLLFSSTGKKKQSNILPSLKITNLKKPACITFPDFLGYVFIFDVKILLNIIYRL